MLSLIARLVACCSRFCFCCFVFWFAFGLGGDCGVWSVVCCGWFSWCFGLGFVIS